MADIPDTTEWMRALIEDLLASGKVANAQLQELSRTLAVITVEIGVIKRDAASFQESVKNTPALEIRLVALEKQLEAMTQQAVDLRSAKIQFWGSIVSAIIAFVSALASILIKSH